MTDQSGARRNIAVLTTAQALGGSSAPIVMSLGGLVGQQLSGNPAWVTLPVSLFGVGLALGTLPAALLMRAWGRRNAYVFAAAVGVAAGLIAAFGIFLTSFAIFCIGSFTAGLYGSYIQSYRFAAADAAEGALKARAISWVMVGGLIAAVVGPQLVIWTRDAVTQTPYAGSVFRCTEPFHHVAAVGAHVCEFQPTENLGPIAGSLGLQFAARQIQNGLDHIQMVARVFAAWHLGLLFQPLHQRRVHRGNGTQFVQPPKGDKGHLAALLIVFDFVERQFANLTGRFSDEAL